MKRTRWTRADGDDLPECGEVERLGSGRGGRKVRYRCTVCGVARDMSNFEAAKWALWDHFELDECGAEETEERSAIDLRDPGALLF